MAASGRSEPRPLRMLRLTLMAIGLSCLSWVAFVTLDAAFDPAAAGAGWTRSESRREAAPGTAVLSLDQVAWRPPGASADVVRSATLEAREGETVALIGRSESLPDWVVGER